METNIQTLAMDFVESRTNSSFTKLYNRLYIGVNHYCSTFIYDKDIVDEMTAIAFAKAFSSIHMYDPSKSSFSTWIYSIAKYECWHEIKRLKALSSIDIFMEDNKSLPAIDNDSWMLNPNTDMEPEEDFDKFYQDTLNAIEQLPDYYRNVFIDHYINGLDHKSIAIKYDIPEATSKTRVFNAKTNIKRIINSDKTHFKPKRVGRRVSNNT